MNEEQQIPFNDYEAEGEVIIEAEEIPKYVGVCDKCLGSGYVIRERNGVMGVLFTATSTDSEGKPIRRLVPCDCEVQVTY